MRRTGYTSNAKPSPLTKGPIHPVSYSRNRNVQSIASSALAAISRPHVYVPSVPSSINLQDNASPQNLYTVEFENDHASKPGYLCKHHLHKKFATAKASSPAKSTTPVTTRRVHNVVSEKEDGSGLDLDVQEMVKNVRPATSLQDDMVTITTSDLTPRGLLSDRTYQEFQYPNQELNQPKNIDEAINTQQSVSPSPRTSMNHTTSQPQIEPTTDQDVSQILTYLESQERSNHSASAFSSNSHQVPCSIHSKVMHSSSGRDGYALANGQSSNGRDVYPSAHGQSGNSRDVYPLAYAQSGNGRDVYNLAHAQSSNSRDVFYSMHDASSSQQVPVHGKYVHIASGRDAYSSSYLETSVHGGDTRIPSYSSTEGMAQDESQPSGRLNESLLKQQQNGPLSPPRCQQEYVPSTSCPQQISPSPLNVSSPHGMGDLSIFPDLPDVALSPKEKEYPMPQHRVSVDFNDIKAILHGSPKKVLDWLHPPDTEGEKGIYLSEYRMVKLLQAIGGHSAGVNVENDAATEDESKPSVNAMPEDWVPIEKFKDVERRSSVAEERLKQFEEFLTNALEKGGEDYVKNLVSKSKTIDKHISQIKKFIEEKETELKKQVTASEKDAKLYRCTSSTSTRPGNNGMTLEKAKKELQDHENNRKRLMSVFTMFNDLSRLVKVEHSKRLDAETKIQELASQLKTQTATLKKAEKVLKNSLISPRVSLNEATSTKHSEEPVSISVSGQHTPDMIMSGADSATCTTPDHLDTQTSQSQDTQKASKKERAPFKSNIPKPKNLIKLDQQTPEKASERKTDAENSTKEADLARSVSQTSQPSSNSDDSGTNLKKRDMLDKKESDSHIDNVVMELVEAVAITEETFRMPDCMLSNICDNKQDQDKNTEPLADNYEKQNELNSVQVETVYDQGISESSAKDNNNDINRNVVEKYDITNPVLELASSITKEMVNDEPAPKENLKPEEQKKPNVADVDEVLKRYRPNPDPTFGIDMSNARRRSIYVEQYRGSSSAPSSVSFRSNNADMKQKMQSDSNCGSDLERRVADVEASYMAHVLKGQVKYRHMVLLIQFLLFAVMLSRTGFHASSPPPS